MGGRGPATPPKIHGRRHGRKLRVGRRALLDSLLPRLEIVLPEPGRWLDLEALFGRAAEDVWLEIGFGAGEHLAWQAAHHARVGLLGAEHFVNGVAGLLRLIEEQGLANIRLLQGDGRDLIAVLPPASIGRCFALFPDPWPKARHHKRRLIQGPFLDRLAEVMKDGAELRLATDHRDYLVWILERLTPHPDFAWLARGPGDWRERVADWPATRYEAKAIEQGRDATYLRFVRRPRRDVTRPVEPA